MAEGEVTCVSGHSIRPYRLGREIYETGTLGALVMDEAAQWER